LIDRLEGAALQSGRRGEDIKGGWMLKVPGRAAGIAHEGGEFGDEGTQTVCRRAVFGDVGMDFLKCRA
jgi:hypothetical protein